MLAALTCCASLLAAPATASACTAAQRADVRATIGLVQHLRASGSAGASDAASVLARARRSCSDARFARAVAAVTSRRGLPAIGQRTRVFGLDLIGASVDGATTAWRLDVVRIAARLAATRSSRSALALRGQLRAAGFGSAAITWSADPTRAQWDPVLQSAVATSLARSRRAVDRRLAGASARAFASAARRAALVKLPLIAHLRIANRVAHAAVVSQHAAARTAARAVAARAFVRVRAARQAGWSQLDGRWSSLAAHRVLAAQAGTLIARVPHAATAPHVRALRAALVTPTDVDFSTLPRGEFYPWPRDAAFDTQSLSLQVDKPTTLTLTVYAEDGTPVRTLESTLQPGPASFTWDGNSTTGETLPPGDYRYNIDAVDVAGNKVRVPGLDQFRIARDTTVPTVRRVSARHINSGMRRIVASWEVEEVHSPQVRSWLLLNDGTRRVSVALHGTLQRGTVRRPITLARGSWSATFVFADGSGNRTSEPAGTVVVR